MLRNDLYTPWFAGPDWGFEIITGEFIGIVVQVEKFELKDEDSGECMLDYHIIKQPESQEVDVKNPVFEQTVELIFNDILREAIENYEHTRKSDPQESSSQ